eukprot:1859229-Prymnesium_polylepis.1
MRSAPKGLSMRLATAPMATPPASAAFCASTGRIFPPESSGDAINVVTVDPTSCCATGRSTHRHRSTG